MPDTNTGRQVDERLQGLHARLRLDEDAVVSYYASGRGYYPPEEAGAERDHFGICIVTADGQIFEAGNHDLPFALQSISKIFAYGLALADHGRDAVLERVGVEPSGEAFHSIVFDERNNRPYNPMVNAGALVTTDLVKGADAGEKFHRLRDVLRRYSGNDALDVDRDTLVGELQTTDRNRAVAYLMRSRDMIAGDVELTLESYLKQCSVHVTCRDLAVMAATLANGCVNPVTGDRVMQRERVRDVLSVMYTCGMYDFAGQWAYEVGVPAKSGVSGGILVVIPGKMGIGVFSPGLDAYGNSVRGVKVCEEISEVLGLHVFATEEEDAILGPVADTA